MSRFNKLILAYLILALPAFSFGQDCKINIRGRILDEHTGNGLPYANVFVHETKAGAVTDTTGFFELSDICPGSYHISFSHIGCKTIKNSVTVKSDTSILIFLDHHSELLNEVVIHGKKETFLNQVSSIINKNEIVAEGSKNLADIIENVQGVSVLRTGSGISKPIIHGLYGNRISILNNDIAQSGQQWGNDHSPEIDPFIAQHISVIKGASALEYAGNSLGGVVKIESGKIPNDPSLHGEFTYLFQTNGRGHTFNTKLEKNVSWIAWRIIGTLKGFGDMKTSDYFLNNTGKREGNMAVQFEKKISDNWNIDIYYSYFNTIIGLLRGAHVGNLSDLKNAKYREIPYYTEDRFSYSIDAPRQHVQHHLLKIESKYFISDNRSITFKYGGQLNDRKEFDVKRGGRSHVPALSLLLNNHSVEGVFMNTLINGARLKTGLQFNFTDNTNDNSVTGRLPLIPDYRSYQGSGFIIFKNEKKKFFYEAGIRYDLRKIEVLPISPVVDFDSLGNSTGTEYIVERLNHTFQNTGFSLGTGYDISKSFSTKIDLGYVWRAPEINEMYSKGLHQGVSGFEVGNRNLNSEKSFKAVLSTDLNVKEKLSFQAVVYYQYIKNYIYLQPNGYILTSTGPALLYIYQQTNASITGTDFLLSYEHGKKIKFLTRFETVNGTNITENIPLVYMPSDNLSGAITYSPVNSGLFQNSSFSINSSYVFKNRNYVEGQDHLPPPDSYFLVGLNALVSVLFKNKNEMKISFQVENMLNEKYRDYLNRQRYFADETGINLSVGINYTF